MDNVCPPSCALEMARRIRKVAKDIEKLQGSYRAEIVLVQIAEAMEEEAVRAIATYEE